MPVLHQPDQHRFTVATTAGDAELVYHARPDGTLDLRHTFVPPKARGGRIASDLVQAAIVHARSNKLKLVATCTYVQSWVARHPEEQELFVS
ncbi:MAG: GNAT family N-acetyltransferase [Gemmatimonadota bacterium]